MIKIHEFFDTMTTRYWFWPAYWFFVGTNLDDPLLLSLYGICGIGLKIAEPPK